LAASFEEGAGSSNPLMLLTMCGSKRGLAHALWIGDNIAQTLE
jgi:hypothetical protein